MRKSRELKQCNWQSGNPENPYGLTALPSWFLSERTYLVVGAVGPTPTIKLLTKQLILYFNKHFIVPNI